MRTMRNALENSLKHVWDNFILLRQAFNCDEKSYMYFSRTLLIMGIEPNTIIGIQPGPSGDIYIMAQPNYRKIILYSTGNFDEPTLALILQEALYALHDFILSRN